MKLICLNVLYHSDYLLNNCEWKRKMIKYHLFSFYSTLYTVWAKHLPLKSDLIIQKKRLLLWRVCVWRTAETRMCVYVCVCVKERKRRFFFFAQLTTIGSVRACFFHPVHRAAPCLVCVKQLSASSASAPAAAATPPRHVGSSCGPARRLHLPDRFGPGDGRGAAAARFMTRTHRPGRMALSSRGMLSLIGSACLWLPLVAEVCDQQVFICVLFSLAYFQVDNWSGILFLCSSLQKMYFFL